MIRRRSFFRQVVRSRGRVLTVACVVVGFGAAGALRVRVDYGVEQFLPSWGEERRTYDEYKALFPREDLRFSLFWDDARPLGVAVLADLERAVRAFESVGLEDVQWIGGVPLAGWEVGRDGAGVRSAAAWARDPAGPGDGRLRAALGHHRDDPLYRGILWDDEQRVWAVHGHLDPAANTDAGRREVERALTAALDTLAVGNATLALSGIPVLRSRIPLLLEADQTLFLGGGAILFFGLLLFFLGRPTHVLVCLVSVLPAYLCTVGLMAALDRPVSILTSFIPIVVLVVGVSDAIHLVVGWRRRRVAGRTSEDAVVETFAELAPACFYTSLTTALGFAALAGTGIGLVMEFGLFTALAIALTSAFGLTVLPALLSFFREEVEAGAVEVRGVRSGMMAWVLGAAERGALRPSRPWVAAFGAVALAGVALGTTLRIDTYLVDDLKEESEVMRELRWIEDRGFGLFQVNVLVQDAGGALHDPDMLDWMARLEAFGRSDPLVQGAVGPPDARMQGDPDVPTDLHRPAEGAAQVVFTVRDAGSAATLPFLSRLDGWLEANPAPMGRASSTGLVRLFQGYTARILSSFGPSLLLAGFLIFGVMVFMFRSLRLGLLAMIPNLFPLVVLAGVMGAGEIAVKPSTVLVFSIAFAIAVDDSIHFLGALRRALTSGLDMPGALQAAVREAGPAILVTTVVVSAGFSLLMLSRFEVLFLVGFLTLTSSLAAVAADLFLFPAVLRMASGRRSVRTAVVVPGVVPGVPEPPGIPDSTPGGRPCETATS